ncbi:MAG: hypothetical protein OXH56_00290 [Gemmatimonadetes bacterium]|nr:hypothetical protein [Gemmatimonadota bacterium]
MSSQISQSVAQALRSSYLTEAAVIVKTADGDRNEHGEWVPGAETETQILVVTAPVTGEDREQLPEGLRLSEARKFWTLESSDAVREGEADGDVVRYPAENGTEYRVIMVDDWGAFRELMAIRRAA